MSVGSLKQRCEDLDYQLEAIRFQERRLMQYALDEVQGPGSLPSVASSSAASAPEASKSFGSSTARTMRDEVQLYRNQRKSASKPWEAAMLADEAHREAAAKVETEQREQEEQEMKEEALAKAKATANSEVDSKIEKEIGLQMKLMLARQGLNSKRLPLRPGIPPCGYFLRQGNCKRLKTCMWDHPEPERNSKGYPRLPHCPPCAPYARNRCCKFGVLCGFDHPEPGEGKNGEGEAKETPGQIPLKMMQAACEQQQSQLLLHLQMLQELEENQDPANMLHAWVKFRMTFANSG